MLPELPKPGGLLAFEARPYQPEWISGMDGYSEEQMDDYGKECAKQERQKCIEIAKKCGIEAFCTPHHKAQAEGYRRDVVRALEAGTWEWIDPYKGGLDE